MKTSLSSRQKYWVNDQIDTYGPFSIIPDEIILEIFSRLNFTVLGNCVKVSKRWNTVLIPTFNNKRDLLLEKIFGPKDWDYHFINNGITTEEKQEAYRSIPLNIDEIPCPELPSKMMIDRWTFAYFPKNLTVKTYGDLLKQKFDKNWRGYFYIATDILEKFGNNTIQKSAQSGWKAMTKEAVRNTKGNYFSVQNRIVKNINIDNKLKFAIIRPPSLLTAIVFFSASFFKSPSIMNETFHTCCYEKIRGKQLIVGNTTIGLIIDRRYNNMRQNIGMNAVIDY